MGSAPTQGGRLLTIFEAAAIMRVSKRTVYGLVHAGDLEVICVDGSFRIPERAVIPSLMVRGHK